MISYPGRSRSEVRGQENVRQSSALHRQEERGDGRSQTTICKLRQESLWRQSSTGSSGGTLASDGKRGKTNGQLFHFLRAARKARKATTQRKLAFILFAAFVAVSYKKEKSVM